VQGKLRWFNEVRGDGVIESDDGESYTVLAADFVGAPPVGRCAGLEVVFQADEASRATEVAVVEQSDPRRARLRSHRAGRS
jgi:hypothetical protein